MTKDESHGGVGIGGGGVLWAAALEEDRDDDYDNDNNNNFFGQETTMEGDYCPFVTVVSSSLEEDWDVHSELSLDEEEEEEETPVETTRPTLFPPSCTFLSFLELETPILTARDFHSLVRACQEREEQDWPSDEDCDPPTVCQHMILSPMKDMEEETNMRSIIVYGEI